MSARRHNWVRTFFALGVGTLLVLNMPSTAKAVLTIQLSSVVTDAAGIVQAPTQNVQTSAAFPGPATLTTPSGANVGGGIVITGPLGAAHTASGPGTLINNTIGSLLTSLVDQLTNTSNAVRIATVVISANGFEAPIPASVSFNLSGQWLNASGSSITARWFEDPANGRSSVTGVVGTTTVNETIAGNQVDGTAGPGNVGTSFFTATANTLQAFSFSGTAALPSNVPFGLTLEFVLRLTPGANLQSRGQAELVLPGAVVPEPSSVAMAICGLPVLGGLFLRRRLHRA